MRSAISSLLGWLRDHQPSLLTPVLIRLRETLVWASPAGREAARASMRLLVPERSEAEIDALARRHVHFNAVRSERRYQPGDLVAQPVEGLEHLVAARERGKGALLAFIHHGHFCTPYSSVAHTGHPVTITVSNDTMRPDAPTWLRYQRALIAGHPDVTLLPISVGFRGMLERLRAGDTVGLSCDGPDARGATVEFLGREWHGLTAAAGLSLKSGAPIVPLRARRAPHDGAVVDLGAPLYPEDYADSAALTRALLAAHEDAVLAWPEAYDVPTQIWVPITSTQTS